MPPKKQPRRPQLVEFKYAVAGHAGTLCDEDGELFIKPCTQAEIDFYESAAQDHPAMVDIMPLFMGSLMLNDVTNVASIDEQLPAVAEHISPQMKQQVISALAQETQKAPASIIAAPASASASASAPATPPETDNVTWIPNKDRKISTDTAVVLENAALGFKRPNIVDLKLGRRLWADDAPLQKRQRFDKISETTTHKELGFRIAGMRVYKGSEDPAELDEEGYRIYDKDWGRHDVTKDNVVDSMRRFIFNRAAGVDDVVGRAVADAFLRELEHVRDVLESEESRMFSSSLLLIFEGDGEALCAAVEDTSASAAASIRAGGAKAQPGEPGEPGCLLSRSTLRVDSGIDMGEDGEMVAQSPKGGMEMVVPLSDGEMVALSDELDESDEEASEARILTLKLIDFAHAEWTPGQGPDENILLGVRSLIKVFGEMARETESLR